MSILTATRRSTKIEQPRLTFGTTMAAEWKKLLTVRSTVYSAVTLVVLSVGMVVLGAAFTDPASIDPSRHASVIGMTLTSGVSFSQLVMAVLAVLIVANEYSTGLIQSTLVAVPRRRSLLLAKTVVAIVTALVLTVVAWAISAAIAVPVLASKGIEASLLEGEVLGGLATFALYMVIVAVFGVFLATILRSTAASIAVVVGVLFVLPIVAQLLPESLNVGPYLLGGAAQTVATAFSQFDYVKDDLAQAVIVVVVWIAASGGAAVTLFTRRDA